MLPYLRRLLRSNDIFADILRTKGIARKRVVLDYSSPNIGKQFHMGNFRSTILGNFIRNIYKHAGHEVVALNYLGDWGSQFALLALEWPHVEKPSPEQWEALTPREKVAFYTKVYVQASAKQRNNPEYQERVRAAFIQMEQALLEGRADLESIRLWRELRSVTIDYLRGFYATVGFEFDVWRGESEEVSLAKQLIEQLLQLEGVKTTADGLYILHHDSMERTGYASICQPEKATRYLTRDLASLFHREEQYKADTYMYVTDTAQIRHFADLKLLASSLRGPDLCDKIHHVDYGRIIGLSTREGRNDSVEYLIEEGTKRAKKYITKSPSIRVAEHELNEVSRQLAESVLMYTDLQRRRSTEYAFSFDKAFDPKQNILLLQEKYSRLNSLEEVNAALMPTLLSDDAFHTLAITSNAQPLVDWLCALDSAVYNSYAELQPCRITRYLLELCSHVGSAMRSDRVQGEPAEVAAPRLLLFSCAKKVLGEGMRLIGLEPTSRM
ncbi:RRT-2 protein [Aphelenchoides avenae]|nr:RRT-2 protein [Aphelenchus avenae]